MPTILKDGVVDQAAFNQYVLDLEFKVAQFHAEIIRQAAVIGWVDAWVSNPVSSYSVSALNGLFAMTRDKIAALDKIEP